MAQWLSKRFGRQFIIENRPGANLRAWEVGLPWAGRIALRENRAPGRRFMRMTRLTLDEMYYDSMKARPTRNPPSAPSTRLQRDLDYDLIGLSAPTMLMALQPRALVPIIRSAAWRHARDNPTQAPSAPQPW